MKIVRTVLRGLPRSNLGLATRQELVDNLLLVSQRQLQVLEFTKNQPHILDKSIFGQALNVFQKQEDLLSQLWSNYALSMVEEE
ncbi:hypothetical protein [Candidatus Paracaedibacter symbiosus]|uniref:hypothetical protein n=1 Tax=Candidatus Paracaedibacter symbiosus TaxID=244582 RepID=UPI0005096569|nr:hypothetical protein [Candidatus Paracaedibacter symbiosus]